MCVSEALCLGYYPGVKSVPGSLALTVPCSLGEMEIALAFEMVLTFNATTILNTTGTPQSIIITLKRCVCVRAYMRFPVGLETESECLVLAVDFAY